MRKIKNRQHVPKSILFFVLLFPVLLQAQDWDSLIRSMNYIPDLIGRNTPWEQVLDSVQLNYPENTVAITEITNTCNILKEQNAGRTYLPEMLPFFYHARRSFEYNSARETIRRKGAQYLSQLIPLLRTDAATRVLTERIDPDEKGTYLTISDLAIDMIEQISGIYFYRDFVQSHRFFSKESTAEKEKTIATIEKWYAKSLFLSKTGAINYYLDSLPALSGSRIFTIENLGKMGDTLAAIRHLSNIYQQSNWPCRSNMLVANMLVEWGVDIATEDCMNKILNYRCMHDNGVECVWFLLKNARADIPYDILAEVVSTERYSRYKNMPYNHYFIWHTIFDQMAVTRSPYSKSILIELLKIKDLVKGGEISGSNWQAKYPGQYESGYRVCDFALLKMIEMNMTKGSINLESPETRDIEITKIINPK